MLLRLPWLGLSMFNQDWARVLVVSSLFVSITQLKPRAATAQIPPQRGSTQLSAQEIFKRVSSSVFVVEALDSQGSRVAFGSGVVVQRPGQRTPPKALPATFSHWDNDDVMTNSHVIESAASIIVRRGNKIWAATIVRCDAELDLCQLHVPGLNAPAVSFRLSSSLQVGERVYAVGAPEGLELTFSEGIISGLRESEGPGRLIQTTAPVSHGSSGGGLFDSLGRLVGVTTFVVKEAQNLNFALPSEAVLALASSVGGSRHRDGDEKSARVADVCEEMASLGVYTESAKWVCRGDEAKSAGKPESAIEAYRKAVQLDPQNDIAHIELGELLERRGEIPEAVAEFREAIRSAPGGPRPHFRLADALRKQGDLDGAIAEYRETLRLRPDFVDARLSLGNTLIAKREMDAALTEMREAVRLAPEDAYAHAGLCRALQEKNDLNGALTECRRALSLKPDANLLPWLHRGYGTLLQADGDLDGAISEFRELVRLQPENSDAHYHLGKALYEKGEHVPVSVARAEFWPETESELRVALQIKPDDAEERLALGKILLSEGKVAKADLLAAMPACAQDDPEQAVTCHLEGMEVVESLPSPEFQQAAAEFRKALSLEPNWAEAHSQLAEALWWNGYAYRDEALREYATACSLDPQFCKDYEYHQRLSRSKPWKRR